MFQYHRRWKLVNIGIYETKLHAGWFRCLGCLWTGTACIFITSIILFKLTSTKMYIFFPAVILVAVKSDTSAGGMRKVWTGRRVCDDTPVVPLCRRSLDLKKQKKKGNFKNDYTVPHSTTFVLCYTVFFCHVHLCANCVELGKLLETVLTPENETRVCVPLCMEFCVRRYQQQKEATVTWWQGNCCFNGPIKIILWIFKIHFICIFYVFCIFPTTTASLSFEILPQSVDLACSSSCCYQTLKNKTWSTYLPIIITVIIQYFTDI